MVVLQPYIGDVLAPPAGSSVGPKNLDKIRQNFNKVLTNCGQNLESVVIVSDLQRHVPIHLHDLDGKHTQQFWGKL